MQSSALCKALCKDAELFPAYHVLGTGCLFFSLTWSHCAAGRDRGSADSAHDGHTVHTAAMLAALLRYLPSLCSHLPRLPCTLLTVCIGSSFHRCLL